MKLSWDRALTGHGREGLEEKLEVDGLGETMDGVVRVIQRPEQTRRSIGAGKLSDTLMEASAERAGG